MSQTEKQKLPIVDDNFMLAADHHQDIQKAQNFPTPPRIPGSCGVRAIADEGCALTASRRRSLGGRVRHTPRIASDAGA
jgi:hypothetical protein